MYKVGFIAALTWLSCPRLGSQETPAQDGSSLMGPSVGK